MKDITAKQVNELQNREKVLENTLLTVTADKMILDKSLVGEEESEVLLLNRIVYVSAVIERENSAAIRNVRCFFMVL